MEKRPLLVVEGPDRSRWVGPVYLAITVGGLAGALLFFSEHDRLPWFQLFDLGGWGLPATALASLLFVIAATTWLAETVFMQGGQVVFLESGILLTKQGLTAVLPWEELAAYADDASDYVLLLRKGTSHGSIHLTVPTPTDGDRAAVLGLLDRRGIPRAER